MQLINDLSFAQQQDQQDPIRNFRNEFIIPEHNGKQQAYFLGNSLGLQPVRTKKYLEQILNDWAQLGVESFFQAKEPWMDYHDHFTSTLATVTGARREELVVMNQLTVNLHLLLVSFYQPTATRYKIICEARAFPSDQYAFETHVRQKGFDPEDAIVEVKPRPGEHTLRTEDILDVIEEYGPQTALVLFGGLNYYTGQVFDMKAITQAAHAAGCLVGFDLAHAAGNVSLQLHDWNVDFACWCSYKYLNSGPGAIGGAFIHQKHFNSNLPRFAGWWGYDKATRFKMEKGFKPMAGAEGWQLSTPSLLLYASHRAALDIVAEAGWEQIRAKQKKLTAWLWFLLDEITAALPKDQFEIITPPGDDEHGCQVSLLVKKQGRQLYETLMSEGFIVDWREPDVIRLAPVPLYNTFEEVWRFADRLKKWFGVYS